MIRRDEHSSFCNLEALRKVTYWLYSRVLCSNVDSQLMSEFVYRLGMNRDMGVGKPCPLVNSLRGSFRIALFDGGLWFPDSAVFSILWCGSIVKQL